MSFLQIPFNERRILRPALHVFSLNTPKNMKQPLYTFHISFKFFVRGKNKLWKTLDILQECHPWPKMVRDAKNPAIHFFFTAFREHYLLFREKCISGLIVLICSLTSCSVTTFKDNPSHILLIRPSMCTIHCYSQHPLLLWTCGLLKWTTENQIIIKYLHHRYRHQRSIPYLK